MQAWTTLDADRDDFSKLRKNMIGDRNKSLIPKVAIHSDISPLSQSLVPAVRLKLSFRVKGRGNNSICMFQAGTIVKYDEPNAVVWRYIALIFAQHHGAKFWESPQLWLYIMVWRGLASFAMPIVFARFTSKPTRSNCWTDASKGLPASTSNCAKIKQVGTSIHQVETYVPTSALHFRTVLYNKTQNKRGHSTCPCRTPPVIEVSASFYVTHNFTRLSKIYALQDPYEMVGSSVINKSLA